MRYNYVFTVCMYLIIVPQIISFHGLGVGFVVHLPEQELCRVSIRGSDVIFEYKKEPYTG
jgi:hypothetical protein